MEALTVGLHPSLLPWAPEITYTFRTLLRISGFTWDFVPTDGIGSGGVPDVYYGPDLSASRAPVRIRSAGVPFDRLEGRVPRERVDRLGLCFLDFTGRTGLPMERRGRDLLFHSDIVLTSFWLLSGSAEPSYPRDARDNLDLSEAFFQRARLGETAVVSEYAVHLRRTFSELGREPAPPALGGEAGGPVLLLTHDVDYPEIVRSVEAVRVLARTVPNRMATALGMLTGSVHFWRFDDWDAFADELGGRATYFFMSRPGSLVRYAMGTPDAFYDVRSERFRNLFRELVDAGNEIALHPSYEAYRSEKRLRHERARLERACGEEIHGVRHHYWHLDPGAPAETLRLQESCGFRYDSTLAFEYYPGFRRGTCHPFRPFHSAERRELDVVEIPPTWMDDHFDRRRSRNGISDPEVVATRLLEVVERTGGAAVLDYHVRGMEGRVFPRYGPWLRKLLTPGVAKRFEMSTCRELADRFQEHADRLEEQACDRTLNRAIRATTGASGSRAASVEVGEVRHEELAEVAHLHHWFYEQKVFRGDSLAGLGPAALLGLFYEANRDNPRFYCDVARWRGRIIGWSVYATRRDALLGHALRARPVRLALELVRTAVRSPGAFRSLVRNARYVGGESVTLDETVKGWWIVAGVRPEYRTEAFEKRAGGNVAAALLERMEARFRDAGCRAWYGVVRPDNSGIVRFLERHGARRVATGRAQGMEASYYVKRLSVGRSGVGE